MIIFFNLPIRYCNNKIQTCCVYHTRSPTVYYINDLPLHVLYEEYIALNEDIWPFVLKVVEMLIQRN